MNYNSAIIGCGNIGCGVGTTINHNNIYTHAGGYMKCSRTNLVALCDANLDVAREASQIWNVSNIYSDIDSLFESNNLDIVSICTPDDTHYDLISAIIKNYDIKCIFAEKPLSLSSKAAEKILNLASDNEVSLIVNYSRRFDKLHRKIKKDISAGLIGNIQTVNGYYTKGTFHNGTHWVDLARYFFGEIDSVIGYDCLNEKSNDPTYSAFVKFFGGFSGYLHSCDENAYAVFEMDILGTKGRIRIYNHGHCCEYYSVGESPYYSGYQNILHEEYFDEGMNNTLFSAVLNIVNVLDNKEKPYCTGIDGLMAVKVAECIAESVSYGNSLCTIY